MEEKEFNQEREFKGVWIPKQIWLDDRLEALDKMIFAVIDSFTSEEKNCFASNKYFADFCKCSERKVSNSITKLIKYGYVDKVNFDGRTRQLRSCLTKVVYYTKEEKKKEPKETKINCNEIVDYLNEKVGSNYKAKSSKTQDLIKARANEGFTEEDFKKVIDIKCAEWSNDKTMSKYLRPETLFGTKFESYLNQTPKQQKKVECENKFGSQVLY